MKNRLSDLHNYLFCQLERLSDESLTGDQLREEINRAKAISQVSSEIVSNGRLVYDAHREFGTDKTKPELLLGNESGKAV